MGDLGEGLAARAAAVIDQLLIGRELSAERPGAVVRVAQLVQHCALLDEHQQERQRESQVNSPHTL